jgi:peroxiredoxin
MRIVFLGLFLFFCAGSLQAMEATDSPASHPLPVGSAMPDLLLRGEISPEQLAHLGLKGPAPRHLSEIQAKHVILVAFSMYCPHCQREAPALVELNALIQRRGFGGDLKLIGVGIGNSDFEVEVFRDKYGVTFPLFSDPDFQANKEIGEVGTPFFYVLSMDRNTKQIRVVDTMLGRMDSAGAYLEQVLSATKPMR